MLSGWLAMLGALALMILIFNIARMMFRSQRPRAWKWAKWSGAVALLSIVLVAVAIQNEDAESRKLGFRDSLDMQRANKHGFSDSKEWNAKRDDVLAKEARLEKIRVQKETAERAKTEAKRAAANAEKAKAEAQEKCLSSWDGSMRTFVAVVSESLRDPASFEHIRTYAGPVKAHGQQSIIMEFRARNGFGGLNTSIASAIVSNENCAILSWSVI